MGTPDFCEFEKLATAKNSCGGHNFGQRCIDSFPLLEVGRKYCVLIGGCGTAFYAIMETIEYYSTTTMAPISCNNNNYHRDENCYGKPRRRRRLPSPKVMEAHPSCESLPIKRARRELSIVRLKVGFEERRNNNQIYVTQTMMTQLYMIDRNEIALW